MKKINLKNLDMTLYTEVLSNGLEIYMLPYDNKKNYYISFGTRFGADILEFTDISKKNHKPPLGIAHFLEHKMFEEESGIDPFSFYAKSGTDCNACTSYDNTEYLCWGSKNFNENLEYLLKFVLNPYFTDQNVKKEKGIIAEEIKMYNDYPDYKLEMKLRECVYKNHPRRLDVAGSVEEIKKITKEDLYDCYNNFYVPSNMFVFITGNFDKEIALEIIKNELDTNESKKLPIIKEVSEPIKVFEKEAVIKDKIETPKVSLGLKVDNTKLGLTGYELSLYLHMLSTMIFGDSSIFRERVREKRLSTGFSIGWEILKDISVLYINSSSVKPDELINEIKEELKNINIDEASLKRIKKVWISREIRSIDKVEDTFDTIYDDIVKYKEVIPNKIDMIKSMKLKVLKDLIKKIDFTNISIVKMEKK